MAFINIKTEFETGNYGTKEIPDKKPTKEIFTSGISNLIESNNITFITSKTLVEMYSEDLGNTTIEDIQKPFTNEIGNPEDTTYNTPAGLSGLATIAPNIETEYNEGRTSAEIPKFTIPETGILGNFVDRTTRDILWMAKYLDPTGPNFFGETGAFWFLENQQFLQTFNARVNTKIYNPLSLFRVRGISPMYQLSPFIDIFTDFPWGNKQYTKWMDRKKSLEPITIIPPPPTGFGAAINFVTDALGIETDNKTLFERYVENTGVSFQLDSTNDMPSNVYNLFWTAERFSNTWTFTDPYPKIHNRDDGSPYIIRVLGKPTQINPRAIAPGGGSFLTDWIQLNGTTTLYPEFEDFTEDWPLKKAKKAQSAINYFAYDYDQMSKVARGGLKKYSSPEFEYPDGAEKNLSIRQINTNQRLSNPVTYGFSQYQKDLDIRQMGSGIPNAHGVFSGSWGDAVDKINMLDYGEDYGNLKDIIQFKIKDIYNDKWIIFRSIITSITDSPAAEWSEKSYVGRQDKVHIYTGVSRNFNFSLKAMAYSLAEIKPLWKKLNYVIGLQYPHKISESNPKMVSPFIKMTLGSFLQDTYGYISSLTVTYPDDFPWELGGYDDPDLADYNVQLPMGFELTIDFKIIPDELLHSKSQHIYGAPKNWFVGD